MKHELKLVIDKAFVDSAMMNIARQIHEKVGYPLAIIAVLKGGAYAAYEVLKLLDNIHRTGNTPYGKLDIVIGHIGLKSYGEEMKSSGEVKLMNPLDLSRECLRERNVVIIDDCIETGITFKEAKKLLSGYDSLGVHTAVLIDKVALRGVNKPDIVGWSYPGTGFLVGCGMGAGEDYRGIPEIYEIEE